ncbi:alpha/beta-hydrolase [Calocera viscosa TUFC12733]|uniref:Alpha/beta-hydrolase n=1 Tax=Calocera viscosa (strain TUFC12733) TaxID=1330018 RepID=A0A167MVT8_CALVF|nr:alpha/beta-hydrolase [Calocera viscosa TUFC12733]
MQTLTPFRYRSLPWKILYLATVIPLALFVQLPWLCLLHLFPSRRPRRSWSLLRTLTVFAVRIFCTTLYDIGFEFMYTDPTERPRNAEKRGWVRIPAVPQKIQGDILELAKKNKVDIDCPIGGYWFGDCGPDGTAGQLAGEGEKVMLYFHSGGYVLGKANDLGAMTVIYSLRSMRILFKRLLSVEYHVAKSAPFEPSGAWPTQIVDGIASYAYLLSLGFKPENVILCGDSAGGSIAFSLAHYLVNHPEAGLAPPAGLLLLSPHMDYTVSSRGPDSSFEKNQATDGAVIVFRSEYTVHSLRGQLSVSEFSADPLCSPGSLNARPSPGSFEGMPKTFIHACGAELALDSIRTFRDRMWADNGKERVEYLETRDVTHDLLAIWQEPERTRLLGVLSEWLRAFEKV